MSFCLRSGYLRHTSQPRYPFSNVTPLSCIFTGDFKTPSDSCISELRVAVNGAEPSRKQCVYRLVRADRQAQLVHNYNTDTEVPGLVSILLSMGGHYILSMKPSSV